MAEARLAHALQALQPQPAGGQEQQTSPPSPQAQRHVLVAGATGVVGRAAVEEFESLGTRVTMVSRRTPAYSTTATHIALDLSDRAACDAALASLGGVTHLVYTALSGVDIAEPRAVVDNTEMLRNCLEPLEHGASASSLRHVSLMQGRKFYAGFSPEELLWPLKERHPRTDTEVNWYFTQEDLLVEHAEKASWAYTIWRPPTVLGFVPGAPLSMLTAIGVYAAVMRELGKPLCYPGGPPVAKQLCDSRLHARAFAWAADAPAARNQAYNIANCDVFIWEAAFPVRIAPTPPVVLPTLFPVSPVR
jgi:nucleoside-diphosphate-sugar epimerase